MFRKVKSVVVFLKIIVSFVLTRPFGKAIFACFHGSEKGGSSGSEKNHFDTNWPLCNVQFCKPILSPHMSH